MSRRTGRGHARLRAAGSAVRPAPREEPQLPPADTAAIVAALRAVPGVADARIEAASDGGAGMLHLILEEGSDDTLVTERVTDLLGAGFGLGVDAERIQVLEDPEPVAAGAAAPASAADPQPAGSTTARASARLVIERLQLRSAGLEVRCAVTLGCAGRTATGEAAGAANSSGMLRAVSAATLRAVEQLATAPIRLEIEHLELISTGAESTVVVWATMLTGAGTARLTGAAAVRHDLRQAGVRATLDALNRRLAPLLPPPGPAR